MAVDVSIIVGTRPEAIKCAPVVFALRERGLAVRLVATGQHAELLDDALGAFGLAADVNLRAMSATPDLPALTARLLPALAAELRDHRPRAVLVQGDTTSTLCGALAAFYAGLPCGHIEAGLRSGTRAAPWPEEMNRELTARLCARHYAPTEGARENLLREGIRADGILVTGQTGVDAALWMAAQLGDTPPEALRPALQDRREKLVFATGHRRESLSGGLARVANALRRAAAERDDLTVLFAAHPNPEARKAVGDGTDHFRVLPPLGYAEAVWLIAHADAIVSDSGGVQEEAPSFGTPVLVTRDVTERPEGMEAGFLRLTGTDEEVIRQTLDGVLGEAGLRERLKGIPNPYGDGSAAKRVADDVPSSGF